MISWQMSLIIQFICISILAVIFLVGMIKSVGIIVEFFRNLGKIKLSKRLR